MNKIVNYKKIRTDIINGKKKCIYMKPKGKREYIKCKGEFVLLSVYIKSILKKQKGGTLVSHEEGYRSTSGKAKFPWATHRKDRLQLSKADGGTRYVVTLDEAHNRSGPKAKRPLTSSIYNNVRNTTATQIAFYAGLTGKKIPPNLNKVIGESEWPDQQRINNIREFKLMGDPETTIRELNYKTAIKKALLQENNNIWNAFSEGNKKGHKLFNFPLLNVTELKHNYDVSNNVNADFIFSKKK